ncbi:uncharacterized protein Fot_07154 [Forsythia ovata]|uniref:Uncharacterized protein n=1 Tax=Forsythia ovata TaxID=205694 RepID=A0ABD1WZ56_9LAMI
MLKRIEPLDTSIFTYGFSDPAKDSMKQTIPAMLGLLPSAQFSVTVSITKRPLDRLILSSIITGYTLWNTLWAFVSSSSSIASSWASRNDRIVVIPKAWASMVSTGFSFSDLGTEACRAILEIAWEAPQF